MGCYYDVLRNNESGLAVQDYLSEREWESTFEQMMAMQGNWERMGAKGRELAQALDIDKTVDGFVDAVKTAVVK